MNIENQNSLMLDKESITFHEIHQRFSETPPGQRLSQNARWSYFQPEYISKPDWISLLGIDANNLDHCRLTYSLTLWFIDQQNQSDYPNKFNYEEKDILKLTALTHDWPEGITEKGDINYEAKTKEDEDNELAVIIPAITSVIGSSHEAQQFACQVKECLKNSGDQLGKAFNCIEAIGYLKTALSVWPQSKTTSDPYLSQRFQTLTGNVFYNSIPKLIDYSKEFYPAKKFLFYKSQIITQAFQMPNSIFDCYDGKKRDESIDKFTMAKNLWHQWLPDNL